MYSVGPGIWRETLKNMKNDKWTLYDLAYGEKIENLKMRNHIAGPGIWRETLKNEENEKHTRQALECVRKLKNVKNEKWTLKDLEYGEKTEKLRK